MTLGLNLLIHRYYITAMLALCVFIILFALALLSGAIFAYPLYLLLANWFEPDFERVVSRCVLIATIILLIAFFKRLGFNSWREIGFNLNQTQFWKRFSKGFGAGVLIMLPVIAGLLISKNRVIDFGWSWSPDDLLLLLITALASGLLIALIEETFFRGAMLGAMRRHSSIPFAVVTTSFIFAFIHFLRPTGHPYPDDTTSHTFHLLPSLENPQHLNAPDWSSGFTAIKNAFAFLPQPLHIADSFIALFLAGCLLGVVKIRSNTLATCMGIHAGWVFAIKVFKRVTDSNDHVGYAAAWLTGDYDGVIGYLASICLACAIIIYIGMKNRVNSTA